MNYKTQLKNITCFIFDIDGVLTDGSILVNGADYQRIINAKDGYVIQYACKLGYKVFLITGGESEHIKKTYLRLGVTEVRLESSNKVEVFKSLQEKYQISVDEVLYMGDDIPDIPLLKLVGLPTAPSDAAVDVKKWVSYVSPYNGGKGCARDVIEQTLRAQGKWLLDSAFYW